MTDLEIYFENTQKPWGKLFYMIVWKQLSFVKSMNLLDFGSGFGISANHFALNNKVIAIEPNKSMCEMRFQENNYTQINGGIERLTEISPESLDLIICHNVLEYIDNKEDYISAFQRLLKTGGKLSLVKHNHLGRVMQKAVFENNINAAMDLLNGECALAQNFGEIKYYDSFDLKKWMKSFGFRQIENLGIRTFYSLHSDNSIRYEENWVNSICELELKASVINEFKDIAFYNHIILEKL